MVFGGDGVTIKQEESYYEMAEAPNQPFRVAKDYDIDIDGYNESDPKNKMHVVKFKQEKICEMQDQRKLVRNY